MLKICFEVQKIDYVNCFDTLETPIDVNSVIYHHNCKRHKTPRVIDWRKD